MQASTIAWIILLPLVLVLSPCWCECQLEQRWHTNAAVLVTDDVTLSVTAAAGPKGHHWHALGGPKYGRCMMAGSVPASERIVSITLLPFQKETTEAPLQLSLSPWSRGAVRHISA